MSSTAKPSPNSCEDSTSTKEKFSLENLRRHFAECHCEDGGLVMDKYIQGFEEVNKFLALLGTVFGWVASDVVAKVDILR